MKAFIIVMLATLVLCVLAIGLGLLLRRFSSTRAAHALENSKSANETVEFLKAAGIAAMVAIPLTPVTLLVLIMAGAPKGDNTLHWAWGITSVLLIPFCFREVEKRNKLN